MEPTELVTNAIVKLTRALNAGTGVTWDADEVQAVAAWVTIISPRKERDDAANSTR